MTAQLPQGFCAALLAMPEAGRGGHYRVLTSLQKRGGNTKAKRYASCWVSIRQRLLQESNTEGLQGLREHEVFFARVNDGQVVLLIMDPTGDVYEPTTNTVQEVARSLSRIP